ncbi:MAG TPA: polymer-forming cytoskeletal protein [Thermoanaerobaculia bacterium]|jgi:cytoskeletal protein CcmA (bactofilin family)|nr:polymer-forming cytoskeletal protein [Thermoanaerobaculia bacterium]
MPIFRRDPPAGQSRSAAGDSSSGDLSGGARRATVTVVAPGTRVQGKVTGATELQIAGELDGEVRVEALVVVVAGGAVTGPIHGQVVRVAGQVAGNVSGSERVEVGAGGSVEGDITAPRVTIAEGAFFKGKIEMQSEKNREPRRTGKAAADAPPGNANATKASNASSKVEAGSK